MKNVLKNILIFFNLDKDLEDQDSIYEEIRKGTIFKGTNLWILIFAIIIASVGLNMNSTAVIIGAMLISPLMGPINGMGYGIATYDLDLLYKSVRNFTFAIIASLAASTAYFSLTPITTAYSELLARTTPTIYDVLIAMFGGLAGIVAISSKQKGNVIPGVAIATALMPPLCTAGFGLATFQFNFFFGAFYLFTINTIFIAFASVVASKLLKFPIQGVIEEHKKIKLKRLISIIILIVLIPSIYFGYNLVKQEEFLQKSNMFIDDISNFEGNILLKHKIDVQNRKIFLVYGGTSLTEIQKSEIIQKTSIFNISDATIIFEKGLTFSQIDEKKSELFKLKEQISSLNNKLTKKNQEIDSLNFPKKYSRVLLNEIRTIYPQIKGCSYAETSYFKDSSLTPNSISLVVLTTDKSLSNSDRKKINNWITERLKNNQVKILYDNGQ